MPPFICEDLINISSPIENVVKRSDFRHEKKNLHLSLGTSSALDNSESNIASQSNKVGKMLPLNCCKELCLISSHHVLGPKKKLISLLLWLEIVENVKKKFHTAISFAES